LPRPLRAISALAPEASPDADALEVVHLNGLVDDGPARLMFSTFQYAARLCKGDREYRRLADDLASRPCLFVGTTLDELVLWQHVELRGGLEDARHRHRSYLVAPSLSRARRALFERVGFEWIESTARELAIRALPDPISSAATGAP
jgi:hypothetical protein